MGDFLIVSVAVCGLCSAKQQSIAETGAGISANSER